MLVRVKTKWRNKRTYSTWKVTKVDLEHSWGPRVYITNTKSGTTGHYHVDYFVKHFEEVI